MNHLCAIQTLNGRWQYSINGNPHHCCRGHEHETRSGAEDCYKEYLLMAYPLQVNDLEIRKCQVKECKQHRTKAISLGIQGHWFVCDDHANIETVRDHLLEICESWES